MNAELQAIILKNAVDEVKNACPEVSTAFIFTNDGEILAKDDNIDEQTVAYAAEVLNAISKRTEVIGGFESATFYDFNNRVHVFHADNYNLAIISSEEIEGKVRADLARILVPTILKVTKNIYDFSQEEAATEESQPEESSDQSETTEGSDGEAFTKVEVESIEEEKNEESQSSIPEPPVTQFMVENVSGLNALAKDTVRVDAAVIRQWKELYGDIHIDEVDVDTFNGQSVRCKYKPLKGANNGRGIIQLSQKIQQELQISKGELVTVKPVIE